MSDPVSETALSPRRFRFPVRDGDTGKFSALVHKESANGALARMQEEWECEVAMQRKVNDRLRTSWREDVPAERERVIDALIKVLRTKTDPELVSAIVEDLREELA